MVLQQKINSLEETMAFGEALGKQLLPGMVLTLEGDLGAGKTTLTKGIAKGLGVKRNVNSPTFTIIKEYEGRIPLYHMDVYRLGESPEEIGLEEYFYGDGVCVVEWAGLVEEYLPSQRLEIKIVRLSEEGRTFELNPLGAEFEFVKELMNHVGFGNRDF